MKSFISALILLGIVLIAVLINSVYVRNASAELSSLAEDILNEATEEKLSVLIQRWKKLQPFLEFSINESKIEKMSELITALDCYSLPDYMPEIKCSCLLIISLCEELAENEKFSLRGIF